VSNKKGTQPDKLTIEKLTEYIMSSYFYYKVCEGCESVVLEHRVFCPLCDSYNFDDSFKRIYDRVVELTKTNREVFTDYLNYIHE
jgi:hypothetical protein